MNIAQYLGNGLNLSYSQMEAISKLANACGMTTLFEGTGDLASLFDDDDDEDDESSSDDQLVKSYNTMKSAWQDDQQQKAAAEKARLAAEEERKAAERKETLKQVNTPLGKLLSKTASDAMVNAGKADDTADALDVASLLDLHEKTGRSAGVDMDFANQSDSEFSGDSENLNDIDQTTINSVKSAAKFDQDDFDKTETGDINTQEQDSLHHIITKMGEFSTKTPDAVKNIADHVVSTLADYVDNKVELDTVREQDSLDYNASSDDDLSFDNLRHTGDEPSSASSGSRDELEDFVADVNRKIRTMNVDDPATQSHLGDLYGEIYTFTTRYTDNQFNDILQTIAGYVSYKNKLEGKVDEMDTDADNYITSNAMKKRSYKSHAVQQQLELNKINRMRKASGKTPWTMEQFRAARSGVTPEEFNADNAADMEFWKSLNADKLM